MSHEAYKAFDRDITTYWESDNSAGPHTLRYEFPTAQVIVKYAVIANNNKYPTDWTFEGSNNGSDWYTLDTQSEQSFTALEKKYYSISNTTAYLYYRLNITNSESEAGIPLVYEVRDIDWNLIGYVKAKSTLEPDPDQILPADPPPTFATNHTAEMYVEEIRNSTSIVTNIYMGSTIIKTAYCAYDPVTFRLTGEVLGCDDYGGYYDEDHYIYTYYSTIYNNEQEYYGGTSSVYLNINGIELEINNESTDNFYIDYIGYLLPDFTDGATLFVDGTDFYYIFSVNWYNDDDQSWWEFFYKKNNETLIRWTGPISEDWEFEYNMPLGFQIDGVDAYCWDGSVGIIVS